MSYICVTQWPRELCRSYACTPPACAVWHFNLGDVGRWSYRQESQISWIPVRRTRRGACMVAVAQQLLRRSALHCSTSYSTGCDCVVCTATTCYQVCKRKHRVLPFDTCRLCVRRGSISCCCLRVAAKLLLTHEVHQLLLRQRGAESTGCWRQVVVSVGYHSGSMSSSNTV